MDRIDDVVTVSDVPLISRRASSPTPTTRAALRCGMAAWTSSRRSTP
ncbi:hypothetical protein I552_8090 [Mycobacterium xenopi 3993]|nr:hypothetical protein I552_8090 [Mycobacterium xenopi 3993]